MEETKKYHLIFKDGGKWTAKNGTVESAGNVKSFDTIEERSAYLILDEGKTFNELGEIVDKTDEEIAADTIATLTARNVAILEELKQFDSKAIKCALDKLDFDEKYPELSAQRTALLTEYNENETEINS